MFSQFFQNTRKPQGLLGKMMLRGMNTGHAKMAEWGFSHLDLKDDTHILDVGCGGGANIAYMLKALPKSVVDGLDYSEESVAFSRKTNDGICSSILYVLSFSCHPSGCPPFDFSASRLARPLSCISKGVFIIAKAFSELTGIAGGFLIQQK